MKENHLLTLEFDNGSSVSIDRAKLGATMFNYNWKYRCELVGFKYRELSFRIDMDDNEYLAINQDGLVYAHSLESIVDLVFNVIVSIDEENE